MNEYYCDKCQRDFSDTVKLCGSAAFDFHIMVHVREELNSARATMFVNWGPNGKSKPNLITGEQTLTQMIEKVFLDYESRIIKKEKQMKCTCGQDRGICVDCMQYAMKLALVKMT